MDLESAATLIRTYEGQLVPGLLQTEDYMRAVIAGAHLDELAEEAERRVALRMARQTLLTRPDAPRLWAVIDEAALRRPVGRPEVMRGQLERLIDATKLTNVVLQILPFGAGAHPGMVGAFSILRFADQELPDVVYVEHLTNALYLDRRDDVNQYLHVMDRISMRAAPPTRPWTSSTRSCRNPEAGLWRVVDEPARPHSRWGRSAPRRMLAWAEVPASLTITDVRVCDPHHRRHRPPREGHRQRRRDRVAIVEPTRGQARPAPARRRSRRSVPGLRRW